MKNYNLIIPEPCHEDWNKMNENEKGRFCQVCSKTVRDFTDSPREEIIETLLSAQGKICGRINSDELKSEVNIKIPFEVLAGERIQNPVRKFFLALLVVFGSSLFYCSGLSGQKVGKVMITREKNTEVTENMPKGEIVIKKEIPARCGLVYTGTETGKLPLGEIQAVPDSVTFVQPENEIQITGEDFKNVMLGAMVILPESDRSEGMPENWVTSDTSSEFVADDMNELIETVNVTDERKTLMIPEKPLSCFPNPVSDLVHIRYEVSGESVADLKIYDGEGKFIRHVVKAIKHYPGIYVYPVSASSFSPGVYRAVLVLSGKQHSVSFVVVR